MKVQVTFTVDVDPVEPMTEFTENLHVTQITAAVEEAVTLALKRAQANGHEHTLQDSISILMDSDVSAKVCE